MEIKLPILNLRPYQREWQRAYFEDNYDRMVLICHRRAGKDLFCINLIASAMQQRVGTYLYLLPEQAHAKRIIWDGMDGSGKPFLSYFPRELIRRINKSEMIIEFKNGSIFRLGGSDQFNKQVGTNPILIVFGEYSLQKPQAWEYMSPVLLENKGKAIFQFTPRSYNHAYDLFLMAKDNPEWYVSKLSIDDTKDHNGNPIMTKADVQTQIDQGMDEALIQQEYYCSFEGPNTGSYYGKLITSLNEKKHIIDFNIEKNSPCYTSWDLGINDTTAIWIWQFLNNQVRFIGTYENSGENLQHYVTYLRQFQDREQVKFARHYAPHDIRVREFGSGRSRIETAMSLGINFQVAPSLPIEDGIQAVRTILPQCIFHKTNCKDGIAALRAYSRKWDDGRKCYLNKPLHDWASNYADAFRYFAISWRQNMYSTRQSAVINY